MRVLLGNVRERNTFSANCGSVVPERDGTYQYESVCEETVGVLTRNVKERMGNKRNTLKPLAERERMQPERYGT